MAVYTTITNQKLQDFMAAYDLGAVKSYRGITDGIENTNYLLNTKTGKYILTLCENRTRKEDLPFFIAFQNHLAERHIPCPRPISNTVGKVISEIAGKPALINSFLDGQSVQNIEPDHCRRVGMLLAKMHLAAAGFDMTRENPLNLPRWNTLYSEYKNSMKAQFPGLSKEIARELTYLNENWPQNIPAGAVHADVFPDNVFFQEDRISGIIDFYLSCTDAYAYDLAITLNAWCFDAPGQMNEEKKQALLRGYKTIRPLSSPEKAAFTTLCRGAALSIILLRLYLWVYPPENATVNRKDPMEYLAHLKHHQTTALDFQAGVNA